MKSALLRIKARLYFPLASYFSFWAKFVLKRWKPKIIVVTGSVGKTTTMHLIESQLSDVAVYSHHANSAFGLAFNILGIRRKTYSKIEWLKITLAAPFKVFRHLPRQKIYIVEADSDRPGEGGFIGDMLKPQVVIWVSSDRTHSMNFTKLQKSLNLPSVESAIAYAYSELVSAAKDKVLLIQPNKLMIDSTKTLEVDTQKVTTKDFSNYNITTENSTEFTYLSKTYHLPAAVSKNIVVSAVASLWLMKQLDLVEAVDTSFKKFKLPPGRSSIFKGIKGTTLIDSTYNSNILSATSMLQLLKDYPGNKKWAVFGDMVEQGELEEIEHKRLSDLLKSQVLDQIVLYGRRTKKYTLPSLEGTGYRGAVVSLDSAQEVITFLKANLKGKEVVLFQGAGFLEAVVESLLKDKNDATKLCRREVMWQKRRAKWGL